MKTSNLILLVMGLFALAFIVTMTVIFCVKDAVPDMVFGLDEGVISNVAGAVVSAASVVAYILTEGMMSA